MHYNDNTMTMVLGLPKTLLFFLPAAAFVIISLFSGMSSLETLIFFLIIVSVPLFALYLKQKHIAAIPISIYLVFVVQFTLLWCAVPPLLERLTIIAIPMLPILFYNYFRYCKRKIPCLRAIGLCSVGFICTYFRISFSTDGSFQFNYSDLMFILSFLFLFIIYVLIEFKVININGLLLSIGFSGIPLLLYVLIEYSLKNALGGILESRFGFLSNINPNQIAIYLDMLFPLMLFMAIGEKKRFIRLVFMGIALLYAVCILFTYSRGSLFGLAAILGFLLLKKRNKSTLAIFTILAVVVIVYTSQKMMQRLSVHQLDTLISNIARIELLKTTKVILNKNLYFFGIGMNNFVTAKFSNGFPVGLDSSKVWSSHNQYLEIWLGWGLPALLGWIILIWGTIIKFARTHFLPGREGVKLGILFGLISYELHGFVDCSQNSAMLAIVFTYIACANFLIAQTRILNTQLQKAMAD